MKQLREQGSGSQRHRLAEPASERRPFGNHGPNSCFGNLVHDQGREVFQCCCNNESQGLAGPTIP